MSAAGLLAPPGDPDGTTPLVPFAPSGLLPLDLGSPLLGTVAPLPDGTGELPRQGPLGLRDPDKVAAHDAHADGTVTDRQYAHGVTVTGGAGGIAACTEELAALAAALAAAARSVQAADVDRRRLAERLGPVGAVALSPLGVAGGLPALERRLVGLSTSVRDAAAVYAEAETDASADLRRAATVAGFVLGSAGPLAWRAFGGAVLLDVMCLALLRSLKGTPSVPGEVIELLGGQAVAGRSDALGALGRLFAGEGPLPGLPAPDRAASEALTVFMAAFVYAAQPRRQKYLADPVPGAAKVLLKGVEPLVQDTYVRVLPVGTRTDRPPRDEADLLALVDKAYPQSPDASGEVVVQRLEHADGTRSWVVAIPGTQSWTLGGPNPFDGLSDLEAVAGVPDDATETVVRAMELAGIGPDEPVVLAGHSLGGIAATRVAGSEAGERYDIVGVLTAGSPVAGADLPPQTAGLHLEHRQDMVPGTAGLPNPDTANRTTVVRDLRVGAAPDEVIGTLDAHDLDAYRETAAMLPADDPSVQGFRAATSAVLGDDVVRTVTWRFQGTRVPLDAELSASSAPPG